MEENILMKGLAFVGLPLAVLIVLSMGYNYKDIDICKEGDFLAEDD